MNDLDDRWSIIDLDHSLVCSLLRQAPSPHQPTNISISIVIVGY